MTAGRHIDYEALAQEAMRGVVRAVLAKVAQSGLVGDHHFYIAFNTQATGVSISKRLKEKYPVEMTIVLQHRFWDLEVIDDRFEVKLTFDGVPERLVVPFRAVKVFYDPSVPYGLQFEESELMSDAARRSGVRGRAEALRQAGTELSDNEPTADRTLPRNGAGERGDRRRDRAPKRPRPELKPEAGGGEDERREAPAAARPAPPPAPVAQAVKPALTEVKGDAPSPPKADPGGAKVVDLSKFRKK